MLNLDWPDKLYEFDHATTFKRKSISLFWYLDNFLEKDETGLFFQINIVWSVFTGWSIEEVCTVVTIDPFIYIESKC